MSARRAATALDRAIALLDRLGSTGEVLTTLAMYLLAITVVYDVVLRALGVPTLWAAEVSIYLMIALAFLGAGATQGADGHFRVSFLRNLAPPRIRLALDALALGIGLLFALAFTYGAWRLASLSRMLGFKTSTIMQVPVWALQALLVAGGVLLTLAMLRDLLRLCRDGSAARDGAGAGEVI